jgi:hypothetical protein
MKTTFFAILGFITITLAAPTAPASELAARDPEPFKGVGACGWGIGKRNADVEGAEVKC